MNCKGVSLLKGRNSQPFVHVLMPHFRNCELVQKQEIILLRSTLMVLIFAGTNFRGNFFFFLKKIAFHGY